MLKSRTTRKQFEIDDSEQNTKKKLRSGSRLEKKYGSAGEYLIISKNRFSDKTQKQYKKNVSDNGVPAANPWGLGPAIS